MPVFAHRDLGWFRARQFSTSAAGDAPLSGDSGIRWPSTSTLLGSPVASVATVGVCLFESDDIISCVTQLPRLSALPPEIAVLSERCVGPCVFGS